MIKVIVHNSFDKNDMIKITDKVRFEVKGYHSWFAVFVSDEIKHEYPIGDVISIEETGKER